MTDLLTRARAGRANALKTRADKRETSETATTADGRVFFKRSRSTDTTPMFISSRARKARAELIAEAALPPQQSKEKSYFVSLRAPQAPSYLLH